jgi:hypothetical protein
VVLCRSRDGGLESGFCSRPVAATRPLEAFCRAEVCRVRRRC